MTIGTDRAQMQLWVDLALLLSFCELVQMMHVDKTGPMLSVDFFKVKSADETIIAVMLQAFFSSIGVAFISIHQNLSKGTF